MADINTKPYSHIPVFYINRGNVCVNVPFRCVHKTAVAEETVYFSACACARVSMYVHKHMCALPRG
jgi:stringent starvation protein B